MGGVRHTMSAPDSTGLYNQQHRMLAVCVLQAQGCSMLAGIA